MKWKERKLIFKPKGETPTLCSHGSMPVAHYIGNEKYRIYFSSRDESNSSYINFVEISINKPQEILSLSESPSFSKGLLGHFDDNGVYSGPIIKMENYLLMLYSGRSNGVGSIYYMNVGLAFSHDNGLTFKRKYLHPILTRSPYDPWMVTAPAVYKVNNEWRMIYTSGIKLDVDGTSSYDLKIAASKDIIEWKQTGETAISLKMDETNISTPCILEHNGKYHLWFSVKPKDEEYKIGYAYSCDGIEWKRDDLKLGLAPIGNEWESEAVSYPFVFTHGIKVYMLYCGNKNGREGFGITEISKDLL